MLMARFLITLGVILVVGGLAWPLLSKLGLGRLPGDIHIEREGFSFFFPITTGLIISAVVSVIFWLLRK
jgi:ribose/xylose/arabinose/galactoside ABC-type transport system permease subunit